MYSVSNITVVTEIHASDVWDRCRVERWHWHFVRGWCKNFFMYWEILYFAFLCFSLVAVLSRKYFLISNCFIDQSIDIPLNQETEFGSYNSRCCEHWIKLVRIFLSIFVVNFHLLGVKNQKFEFLHSLSQFSIIFSHFMPTVQNISFQLGSQFTVSMYICSSKMLVRYLEIVEEYYGRFFMDPLPCPVHHLLSPSPS